MRRKSKERASARERIIKNLSVVEGMDLAGKFKVDSSIDASRIKIAVENGSVTLSGEISSRAEERKARDIALDTRYVKDVRSELEIAP